MAFLLPSMSMDLKDPNMNYTAVTQETYKGGMPKRKGACCLILNKYLYYQRLDLSKRGRFMVKNIVVMNIYKIIWFRHIIWSY